MLPRLVQLVLVRLGHEARFVRAEHLSTSRWLCARSRAVEANVGGDQHDQLPRLAQESRDPDHEDKSMAWIPECCWPVQGTTDPARLPVLEQTMLMHRMTEIQDSVADVCRRGDRHQPEDSVRPCRRKPCPRRARTKVPREGAVVSRRSRPPRMTDPRTLMRRS